MIRKRFAYHRPADVTEVIEVLAAEGRDACVLAGGTLVVPELTIGSVQPTAVVDLRSAGLCATLRADDELLSEIAVAYGSAQVRFGYYKLKLCESSWPIATAACAVTVRADGVCTAARLALGGVAAIPVVVPVEDILVGTTIGETELTAVAARAEAAVVTPWSDVLADGTYRRGVAGVVAKRALSRTTLPTPP